MPTILQYKDPFTVTKITVLAGTSSPSEIINIGNFTPIAILFPESWDAAPTTFSAYIDKGGGNYVGGSLQQPNADPLVINTAPGWLPLDQTIFGAGVKIFSFESATVNQSADRDCYVLGAPLYTITI